MTINEKIDAFVLAQGNQVGAGVELANILKEIAAEGGGSEPLMVEGTYNFTDGSFTPNPGEPSFSDAKQAFKGNGVILKTGNAFNIEMNTEVRVSCYFAGSAPDDVPECLCGTLAKNFDGTADTYPIIWNAPSE